jgi:hypothetical protein
MLTNDGLSVAMRELALAGVKDIQRNFNHKHILLEWRAENGTTRRYWLAKTPSDHRAAANVRAAIRRMLTEDGVLVAPEKKPAKKRNRRRSRQTRSCAWSSSSPYSNNATNNTNSGSPPWNRL